LVSDANPQNPALGVQVFGHAQAQLSDGNCMLLADAQFSYQLLSMDAVGLKI
jgi:hypothetical protein